MSKILSSASRIVLIMMAVTLCAALFLGKIDADKFMIALGMVFTYYFAKKDPSSGQI